MKQGKKGGAKVIVKERQGKRLYKGYKEGDKGRVGERQRRC